MSELLENVYVFLWAILAVLMFFTGRKQGSFGYVLSLFFVYMTVWYALDTFWGYPMFEGVLSIVFRCVLVGFLALFVSVYFLSKRKNNTNDRDKTDN